MSEIYTDDIFDNKKFFNIFVYISYLNCLIVYSKGFEFGRLEKTDRTNSFVVANDTGHFAFNTWLRSFFGGIKLYGSSSTLSSYDNVDLSCAYKMLEHDAFHYLNIKARKNPEILPKLEIIYHNILKSNMLTLEK